MNEMTRAPEPSRWRTLVRLVCHGVVWAVVLVPTWVQSVQGQRPSWDDAVIALRSWAVLSSHAPLLGQASTVTQTGGHQVFDLGPLEYWLLALPVHLDRSVGLEFGAALCAGIALSLAVEATWRVFGPWGAVVVAASVANVAYQLPFVLQDLVWNPNFGLLFLVATLAIGAAVARGRLHWWPVEVATASVAMQCHSFYVLTAGLITVVAPLLAWTVHRDRRWRPLVWGGCVWVLCWWAPLFQEVTGHPGNLTLLLRSGSGRSTVGFSQAFEMIGSVGSLRPLWTVPYPSQFFAFLPYTYDHDPATAALVFLAPIGIGIWAAWTKRTALMAVAAIAVCSLVGFVITVASMPTANLLNLEYLLAVLWVYAVLWWLTLLGGVVAGVQLLVGHRSTTEQGGNAVRRWILGGVALILVGFSVLSLSWVGRAHVIDQEDPWRTSLPKVHEAARAIAERFPDQPIVVMQTNIDPDGLAWLLDGRGQEIGIGAPNGSVLGADGLYRPTWPLVDVDIVHGRVVLHVHHPQS